MNVSTATIRNWIKTGYLNTRGKGLISKRSVELFQSEIAGKEKLHSRANKSQLDKHDHTQLSLSIPSLISEIRIDDLSDYYERTLSNSYRNQEGIYYTPSNIIQDMFKGITFHNDQTFLDPCCGTGNFLIEAIRNGVHPKNIYGFDTDPNAVMIARERIKHLFGYDSTNIKVGNFLEIYRKLELQNDFFDFVFTNPPWGKKILKSEKEYYSKLLNCGKSIDTTSLFLSASLKVLNSNGLLGFLIQEAFFNISTFENIRMISLEKTIPRIIDYDRPFKGLLTKAQAIILKNKPSRDDSLTLCETRNKQHIRHQSSFFKNPKKILNFWTTSEESEIISQIFSKNHVTLENNANWALGIVTGNNEKYCSTEQLPGYLPVYKGSDISKNKIKDPSTFIPPSFDLFQQVAPLEIYLSKEKLIYKFISNKLCFFHDDKQRYILNSANILIPNINVISCKDLSSLLNSEIMNWLFSNLFNTHKILRGDLESLPIHIEFFKEYGDFNESNYLEYLGIIKNPNGSYRVKK
ncbi:MAG: N-6 DNA methylase [Leptospiraceae bacterium]|nr:N-6 DNA methylase [Leptospiraceae bacterium]